MNLKQYKRCGIAMPQILDTTFATVEQAHAHYQSTIPSASDSRYLLRDILSQYNSIMSQLDTLSLNGKVAIVTGSGRWGGLGAGIALVLARNGASVAITHVAETSAARAQKVVDEIKAAVAGAQVLAVQADVSTVQGATKLAHETLSGFGTDHIDILGKCFS